MNSQKLTLILTAASALFSGCVAQSRFAAVESKLTETETSLAASEAHVAALQRQLAEKSAVPAGSRNPPPQDLHMPVRLAYRRSVDGQGYVAVLTTSFSRQLPIRVSVISRALGTTRKFRIFLQPEVGQEIGNGRAATIAVGDEIKVSNPDFETLDETFHPSGHE